MGGGAIFDAFVQELLNMPINLLLALYLVYARYLFNMGPAYMFSRGVETLQIDGYLTLVTLDPWRTDGVSSADEVWGTPFDREDSPKCGILFVKVCCRAEDFAGRVSLLGGWILF